MQEQTTEATPVKRSKVFKYIKWTALVIGGLFVLIVVLAIKDGSNDNKPSSEPNKQANEQAQTVEPVNVNVTSQIVKRVDGKYRYFFDIRNNDTKDFEGEVTIWLVTEEGKEGLFDKFNTTKPISPNLGTSQYIDANTGPVSVHGANGISSFKYEVKVGNQVVKNGEGKISSSYESL